MPDLRRFRVDPGVGNRQQVVTMSEEAFNMSLRKFL
jgi:hypothetical protein